MKDTAFAIVFDGSILHFTIRHMRRDCVKDAVDWYGGDWKTMRERGYACRKVRIEVIES